MRIVSPLLLLTLALHGQDKSLDDFLKVTQVKIEKQTNPLGGEYYSAEAELFCSSSLPITAYALKYTTTYADGTTRGGGLWEDFIPTLPLVGAKVLGPRKIHLGPLRRGDTHSFLFSLTGIPSKAVPTKVTVEVTAVIFDDCTTAGRDQRNIDWVFSDRQKSLKTYRAQLTALGDARRTVSEDKIVAHLRSKLSSEEKGLAKGELTRKLDEAERQVSLGRMTTRSWLDLYEKQLADYVMAFEKHQTKKGGQQ